MRRHRTLQLRHLPHRFTLLLQFMLPRQLRRLPHRFTLLLQFMLPRQLRRLPHRFTLLLQFMLPRQLRRHQRPSLPPSPPAPETVA